jgi:hypothetical protein
MTNKAAETGYKMSDGAHDVLGETLKDINVRLKKLEGG